MTALLSEMPVAFIDACGFAVVVFQQCDTSAMWLMTGVVQDFILNLALFIVEFLFAGINKVRMLLYYVGLLLSGPLFSELFHSLLLFRQFNKASRRKTQLFSLCYLPGFEHLSVVILDYARICVFLLLGHELWIVFIATR